MGFWVFGLVLGIGIGPRDEEDATVANNDANANANDGPKTSDMTQNNAHSAAQRDPIRSHPSQKQSQQPLENQQNTLLILYAQNAREPAG